ncbi:hypothetical protein K439DRAFT_1383766 [Ramaria rubella]|nr:hypothetical protein K439DRAFT_1383766 [Ramaria rubella]
MSNDGFQITIPTFDDDDFGAAPNPFGRSNGFGSSGFGAGTGFGGGLGTPSGQSFGGSFGGGFSGVFDESPTPTPMTGLGDSDRSYFHSRGDSITSEGSVHSAGQSLKSGSVKSGSVKSSIATIPSLPAHSSNSSIGTTSHSVQSRKSSFASIRNAFKKGGEVPPPMPPIDHQPPPHALKNPSFSRGNSVLPHAATTNGSSGRRPSVTAAGGSPQNQRPSTPQRPTTPSGDSRTRRIPERSVSLSRSQPGSSFYQADHGSDPHFPISSSPPPVPKMPNEYMNGAPNGYSREHMRTPSLTDSDEHQTVLKEPRTPAEYALHAVFTRFVLSADHKVTLFLKSRLNRDPPYLTEFIGPGVDPTFDELLESLARIAQKQLKRVVESVLRWRNDQSKSIDESLLRLHMNQSPASGRTVHSPDTSSTLKQRKAIVSIYIACRALIVVFSSISKDQLGPGLGNSLEEITFEQFRRPDLKVVSQSVNHRANADIAAQLLGHLSNVRFESVTDRFLAELKPVAAGYVTRDGDLKYENLVQGLKHVQIKVWPPEAFDEGAEFLLSLSKSFGRAHGFRLKTAFAETLTHLLHSIGKTAQHEVNHPDWAKAIETIFPKAQDMMNKSKARYWHAAYPLVIASICVAPHEYFLKNWIPCFEAGVGKLKERSMRIYVVNGMMRLIWTYLYRCQESASTTQTRLDNLMKHFFPPHRLAVSPSDDAASALIYIVHFIIARHFDYGSDLALSLMQESTLTPGKQRNINIEALAPERSMIGFRAILLSLTCMEKEKRFPVWPSSCDFSTFDSVSQDWPLSGDKLPELVMSKSGMPAFIDRLLPLVSIISLVLSQTVGSMTIFDEKWSYRPQPFIEEAEPQIVRQHPEGKAAYPRSAAPQMDLLVTLFDSWPRCLNDKSPISETLDMLLRGLINVEPAVADAASRALLRFANDQNRVTEVLDRFNRFLFGPYHTLNEGGPTRLFVESARLLRLWSSVVETWIHDLTCRPKQETPALTLPPMTGARASLRNTEAGALFLLTYTARSIRIVGVNVLRHLAPLSAYLEEHDSEDPKGLSTQPPNIIDILKGHGVHPSFLEDRTYLLDANDRTQLAIWREHRFSGALLRLAESEKEVDRRLWRFVFPSFIRLCMEHHPQVANIWRETLNAAVLRYHHVMSSLAVITGRTAVAQNPARSFGYNVTQEREKSVAEFGPAIEQWHFWIRALCAAAVASDTRSPVVRDHARMPSDLTTQRERLSTARGLFRHLTAFLASEHNAFRDAIVSAFGSIHQSTFATLLEDLQPMTRHILDGRSKIVQRGQGQEHLFASVAHIYQLTAHFVHDPRSLGDHASLHLLLAFVRETKNFLTRADNRDDADLHALRRYFCGVVEHLFDRLNTLKDSDRFMSRNTRLSLYRLCEEWCQVARPSEIGKQRHDAPHAAEARSRVEADLASLAGAASGAMASLCQGAFFSSETAATSPTRGAGGPAMYMEPLTVDCLLERIIDMMASNSKAVNESGRKALTSLLKHPYHHEGLTDAAVRWSFVTSKEPQSSKSRFFNVVVDVIRSFPGHHFTFGQMACLGLCNLGHGLLEVRQTAYNLLEELHTQSEGQLSLAQFECAIGSSAPTIYLHAQRQLSDLLAAEHSAEGGAILAQCAMRLPQVYDNLAHSMHERILQFLEPWIGAIDLMPEGYSQLSPEGHRALCNLYSLTYRYVDCYPDHIQALWARLVDVQYPMNSSATVKFLVEQAARRGNSKFIVYAGRAIACLSRTLVGQRTFEDLCSVMDPTGMSQAAEPESNLPDYIGSHYTADLHSLLPPEQPRPTLGTGELAMLFLADIALERSWDLRHQLPTLLHALFTHFDHRLPFVEQQARRMLFQLLCAWVPGYDELSERSNYPTRAALKASIDNLEASGSALFWSESDTQAEAGAKLSRLCNETLVLLEPLCSQLRQEWGEIALHWGTACASRPIAVRSLQLFRVLMPKVNRSTLAGLLGRLSNTVADPDESIQAFTNELLLTLTALARSPELDTALLPQYFWSAYACLSTTVEVEYAQALEMLDVLLDNLDLNNPATIKDLLDTKPVTWAGHSQGLQRLIIIGLKSAVTSEASFGILSRLAEFDDNELLDPTGGRLRDLFTVSLPWCLNAMDMEPLKPAAIELGIKLARLAENANLPNLARIMVSFSKSRFRTKDDFLRQSISCLREYFAPKHWTEVATLLLSLVLNPHRWLRIKSMQVLKGLFAHRESRNPLDLLGSELLMPLLRLLQTDLASQALEVLDEPLAIAGGGPKAAQVLRMSMRMSIQVNTLKPESVGTGAVFGVPSDTGWCIAQPARMMQDTRLNVMLTYDMCRMPRPSLLIFEPEPLPSPEDLSGDSLGDSPQEDDLGNLLGRLAGLNSYFKDSNAGGGVGGGVHEGLGAGTEPSEAALQRAHAILSKSSQAELVPVTPLADQLFDVAPPSPRSYLSRFEESDEEESEGEDSGEREKSVEEEQNGDGEERESDGEDSFAFDRKSRFFGRVHADGGSTIIGR